MLPTNEPANQNGPEKKDDGFFDRSFLDQLDQQIAGFLGSTPLLQNMEDAKRKEKEDAKRKRKAKIDVLDFKQEVEEYWYVYLFLAVSILFTGTLGIYMGISPYLYVDPDTGIQMIQYNTDAGHIVLAIVYFIAFITLTEAAFGVFKWLYHTKEETNSAQNVTSILGMIVSGFAILMTGISGGKVIASNISFLSKFVTISNATQEWVVIAIPVLITFYTFLVTIYSLSSERARHARQSRESKRIADLNHTIREDSIRQIGSLQLQAAEIAYYKQLIQDGKITAAQGRALMNAKITLGELELELKKDLDGSGTIGNVPAPALPRVYNFDPSAAAVAPATPVHIHSAPGNLGILLKPAKTYSLAELLAALDQSEEQARDLLTAHTTGEDNAWDLLKENNYLPEDMTKLNFGILYRQLMANPTQRPAPTPI